MRLSSLTSNLYHYRLIIIIINSNQSELGFAGTSWKVHQLPLRNFHSKEHKKLLVIHQCSDFVVSHLKLTLFKFTVNSGSAVAFCATKSWIQWNKINLLSLRSRIVKQEEQLFSSSSRSVTFPCGRRFSCRSTIPERKESLLVVYCWPWRPLPAFVQLSS